MKKFYFLFCSLLLASAAYMNPSNAKAQAFEEGANYVQVGYGFGTILGAISKSFDIYDNVKINNLGPIYLKFEHAMSDRVGLGVNIAYATNNWAYDIGSTSDTIPSYRAEYSRSTYSILARVNYHFSESDKFDPYIGIGLGYRSAKWDFETTDPDGGGSVSLSNPMALGFEMTIGARYFFTDNFGLYAEVGAAKSVAQVGLAAKF